MKKYIGLIIGLLPLFCTAQMVMNNNYYVVLAGGSISNPTSIVLTDPVPSGMVNNGTGWIISENEFNQVQWNIGTGTGVYMVPFGYSTTDYLPVSFDITGAGTGAAGTIKFSTYHGSSWDNNTFKPSDVTNLTDFGKTDYSMDMVDRFWVVDAGTGYITRPTGKLTFTYVRSGIASEIALPNYIVEGALVAQRFNSTLNKWDDYVGSIGTDVVSSNTGNVSTGTLNPADLFRSWTLANDSVFLGVNEVTANNGQIIAWPNPVSQTINIRFVGIEGDAIISIVDALGRELITKNLRVSSGTTLPIDVSQIPAGLYFIRLNSSTYSITAKFVRQ